MIRDKDLLAKTIRHLYVEEKLSTTQIGLRIGLSPSGVGHYLKRMGIQKRSVSEAVTALYMTKFDKVPFSIKTPLSLEDKKLKLAGVMLYWGEGAKTGGTVKFANSDPLMIKVFLRFLREICGIHEDRLKILVHRYPDQSEAELRRFWSIATGVPYKRFYKSFVHPGGKGTYKNKAPYGTLAMNYSDTKLLVQILDWCKSYQEMFLATAGVAQ